METRSEEKPDGLEIVSIGSLYAGPLDKKYWSSSRGKDRYPYPVGYHALRTYAGVTYEMEIQEGVKGPLFTVTSPSGESFSGRTPVVSWEYFWKKNGPKVKNWNGKRFCGKIDGIELFGFRNPFVQRLLRELVANVHGVSEQGMTSLGSLSGLSTLEKEVLGSETCEPPDLIVYLGKQHGTRKRSKRQDNKFTKALISECPDKSLDCLEISTSSEENKDTVDLGQFVLKQQHSTVAITHLNSKSSPSNQYPRENSIPSVHPQSLHDGDHIPMVMYSAVATEMLGEFLDSETEMKECTTDAMELAQMGKKSVADMKDKDMLVPDSIDAIQDEVDSFTSLIDDQIVRCNPDEDIDQNRDQIRSLDNDVAGSMMALLLPSAVPLLKKTYKRKVRKYDEKNNSATYRSNDFPLRGSHAESLVSSSPPEEQVTRFRNSGGAQCIVPDSLEDDQHAHCVEVEKPLPSRNEQLGSKDDDHKAQPMGDNSPLSCLLRRTYDSSAANNESTLQTGDSCCKLGRDFPLLESEVMSVVVEGSLPAIEQGIDAFRNQKSGYFPKVDANFDATNTSDRLEIMSSNGKENAGFIENYCPVTETSDPLPADSFPASNKFKVPFSESIIFREMNLPCNAHVKDDQRHGLISLLQDPVTDLFPGEHLKNHHEARLSISSSECSMKSNEQCEDFAELIGCYLHPFCIRSAMLKVNQGNLHVCTFCGPSNRVDGFLFLYHIPITRQKTHPFRPSFLGYTSIMFSISGRNSDNQRVPRHAFQLTPNGKYLVFANCVKAPSCREKDIRCICSVCKSGCSDDGIIKIVHLELGFASTVAELRTDQNIHFILVCETNHLLAVEGGGNLRVWLMEPAWSESREEFVLPGFDFVEPSSIDLKCIPRCDSLIVGHNGAGDFCLWDISSRMRVSKFSASGNEVSGLLPLGWLSPTGGALIGPPPEKWEPASLWLLVHGRRPEEGPEAWSTGWRLALLVNDSLLLGRVLDIRGTSVGALYDLGITGTSDGRAYLWELTSGRKCAELHPLTDGGAVTSIVADEKSGAFAVIGGDSGELRVYLLSKKAR